MTKDDEFRRALEDIAGHMENCPIVGQGCALHMRDTARIALGLPLADQKPKGWVKAA